MHTIIVEEYDIFPLSDALTYKNPFNVHNVEVSRLYKYLTLVSDSIVSNNSLKIVKTHHMCVSHRETGQAMIFPIFFFFSKLA